MQRHFILLGIVSFLIMLFIFPSDCLEGARNGLLLWSGTIVPTLLPFLILTKLMIRYQNIGNCILYTMIFGCLCGYPLGATLSNDFVCSERITKKEGQCLLILCNNISPMFCIGYTIPLILHHHIRVPFFFFCLYAPNILYFLYLLWQGKFFPSSTRQKKKKPLIPFDVILSESLKSIFTIGIYIMLFSIVSSLLQKITIFPLLTSIMIGTNEISTGLSYWGLLNVPRKLKTASVLAFSSFGGLCSVAQTRTACKESRLSIRSYIMYKLFFSLISFCLAYSIL